FPRVNAAATVQALFELRRSAAVDEVLEPVDDVSVRFLLVFVEVHGPDQGISDDLRLRELDHSVNILVRVAVADRVGHLSVVKGGVSQIELPSRFLQRLSNGITLYDRSMVVIADDASIISLPRIGIGE